MSANQERRERTRRTALRHFLLDALLTLDGCAYVRGPVASKDGPPAAPQDDSGCLCAVCGEPVFEDDGTPETPDVHHECLPEYWLLKADDYSESAYDREREARGFEPDHDAEDEGHA